MAEIIILGNEKKCDYVTPDGMVKEGPEETAHRSSFLISLKRSSPWEEKESQKDSPGLKDKSEEIAASEQNTSKGKDRSLPCSNKKRKRKTCITKSAAQVCSLFEPKYKWMPRLILLGMLLSGANGKGVDVQREDFRGITIATSETEVATYSVPTPVDGANYLIYAKDGNKPGNFKCTPEFVEVHKSCTLEVGDKDKTECEGLQIFRNDTHTHLTVDGSKLTHDYTAFCILQHFPESHTLYPLAVGLFKEHDQDINECASNPCKNGGTCVDGLDSYTCNCAKGYNGANCEIDVNECASNPCQNGGACEDGLDSYACNCAKGYDGANCEIDNENPVISGCPSDQSVNTGSGNATALVTWTPPTATDNSGTQTLTSSHNPGDSFPIGNNTVTYTSRDAAGNTDTCTFLIAVADINECASNPCKNGGMCVDGLDSYTCYCSKGYDGANCEIGSDSTYWKNASIILAIMLAISLILNLVYFLCCRKKSTKRVREKSAKQVQDEDIKMGRQQSLIDHKMSNGSPA